MMQLRPPGEPAGIERAIHIGALSGKDDGVAAPEGGTDGWNGDRRHRRRVVAWLHTVAAERQHQRQAEAQPPPPPVLLVAPSSHLAPL